MKKFVTAALLLWCLGNSFYAQAAEAFKFLEEGAAEALGAEGARATQAALEEAMTKSFGQGAIEELQKLPEATAASFRKELSSIALQGKELSVVELQSKLTSQLESTLKTTVIETKGLGLPEGFTEKFKFTPEEMSGMKVGQRVVPGVDVPGAGFAPVKGSVAELEPQLQQARSELKAAKSAMDGKRIVEAETKVRNVKAQVEAARASEVKVATENVQSLEQQVRAQNAELINAEPEKAAVAKQKLADLEAQEQAALENKQKTTIKSAKTRVQEAEQLVDEALANKNSAEAKLKKVKKGTPEYEAAASDLEKATVDLEQAAKEKLNAQEEWKRIEYETLNWRDKIASKVFSKAKAWSLELTQQLIVGTIFLVPGWVQQMFAETINKKALSDTLQKNQRFGKIWMTLPRCFINEENPAASLYVYIGLEDGNKDTMYNGTEKTLQDGPANLYTAAPSYGEWGSVALTDPNFPNTMAHLNTGFLFVGDGVPANTDCPALQLIGNKSKYPNCSGVLQNERLNKLYGPINAGASGTVAEGQFMLRASGYTGSPLIAKLLDPEINQDWKTFYPKIEPSMRYGELLKNAIGSFRSPVKVGDWTVREIDGLGTDFAKLVPGAKGADKQPYVAQGIWVYQSADTQRVRVVRNQMLADAARAGNVNLVWDYIVALTKEGVVIPVQEVKPANNGFQQYTYNPETTRVHFLCSLLQDGILGGSKGPFMLYEIESKTMVPSTVDSPLEKDSDFKKDFDEQGLLKGQVQAMYQFIKTEMVKGPFMIGPKKLEITEELLDANIPVYKITGGLEDGSDDYVYPTDVGGNGVMLPNDKVKYIWSLVTSRVYRPDNFSPYDEDWYAGITDKGTVRVGPKPEVGPYKGSLSTLLLPQDFNPIKIEEGKSLPVPDYYVITTIPTATKSLAATKSFMDQSAPAVIKDIWSAIQGSLFRWRRFMLEEQKAGNLETISNLTRPKTWGARALPIQLTATSAGDILNGFYIYTSPEYPLEYLIMSNKPQFDASAGDEFANQDYALSLSSGNVYQKTSAQGESGKIVATLDPAVLWQQLQGKVNFAKVLAAQKDAQRAAQMQQNVTRLENDIKNSQVTFNAQHAAEQYGNNLFGAFNFFINKKDLATKNYFYQDVTDIQNPLSKLNQEGDVNVPVDIFIFGVTNAAGVTEWGAPLTGAADRALNLATGAVYGRGGFLGAYAQLTEDSTAQITTDGFLNIVLAAVKNKGMVLRPTLTTKLNGLISETVKLLDTEKKFITDTENKERAQSMPMPGNLGSNLRDAPYITNFSNIVQKYLKQYGGKYYLAEQDSTGNIVSYTDYDVKGSGESVVATYAAKPNIDGSHPMLMRVTGWDAQNARARAGVIVDPSGKQSLAIGVDQPQIPLSDMVKLATVPAGGAAKVESFQAALSAALQEYTKQFNAFKPGGNNSALLQAQAELSLQKLLYESAQEFSIAIANGDVKASVSVGYEYYFNKSLGAFFCKVVKAGPYYLDLSSGLTYETNGVPRMRKDPLFVDGAVRAIPWFEGETKSRQLMTVLPKAAPSNNYGIYVTTVQIPPDTYVPAAGMAAVTFTPPGGKAEEAIQQTCTNIDDPSDEKTVVTNDYIRGNNKNVAMMEVWNVQDGKQVKIGSFRSSDTDYFAHLLYIQTRAAGTQAGFFDPKAVLAADSTPAVLVWDGGPELNFKQLYYEYSVSTTEQEGQFITLAGSGDTRTGSFTDSKGTARSITVKKEAREIATATIQNNSVKIIALWISIQEGNKVKDYRYDASIVEIDTLRQVKNNWGINVVTDMYGQTRLAVRVTSLKTAGAVQGVPANDAAKMQEAQANIMFDGSMNRFLYKLTSDKARTYGLKSYEPTMQNWWVDLESGILYNLDKYPVGRSLTISDMHKLMTNLRVAITRDSQGKAIGLHYRAVEDVGK